VQWVTLQKIGATMKQYKLIWLSQYGREEIDTAKTLQEAEYLRAEYQLAYQEGLVIIK
jgi:hypothetical protein